MSISLIGIIWVQIYWIHNGIVVKEAQFDQLVNDALNHVITDVEDKESSQFIHKHIAEATSEEIIDTSSIQNKTKKIKKWVNKFVKSNTEHSKDNSFNYEMTSDGSDEGMEMKISINGDSQVIDVQQNLEKLEKLGDFLDDSLIVVGDEDMVFGNRFGNIMVKMIKEFKDIDKPIQHLLKSITIEPIIKSNLEDNGISTPFNYAVLNDDKVITQFSSDDFIISDDTYKVSLFKHNLFGNSAQLAVNFKGKKHYVLKAMWLMVTSSIVFTLIIILTFASTIHYMFKQKKLSEMKNDFINNMTHEFKTPISTISLAVDSITHPKVISDEKQINHFADIIREENKRMNLQVESVLNTALSEKEELDFNKTNLDLSTIIQEIPERMKLQLDANSANLILNQSDEKLTVLADGIHIQNAICNLIDNAIKYNESDPEIRIDTNLVNGFCEIKVTDNGIGMSNETQKKVFDKFYRVEKGNIHTIKGFGIGLSYVKAIIEAHKGLISIKSKPNKGTTITINLPATS